MKLRWTISPANESEGVGGLASGKPGEWILKKHILCIIPFLRLIQDYLAYTMRAQSLPYSFTPGEDKLGHFCYR